MFLNCTKIAQIAHALFISMFVAPSLVIKFNFLTGLRCNRSRGRDLLMQISFNAHLSVSSPTKNARQGTAIPRIGRSPKIKIQNAK